MSGCKVTDYYRENLGWIVQNWIIPYITKLSAVYNMISLQQNQTNLRKNEKKQNSISPYGTAVLCHNDGRGRESEPVV